MKRTLIIVGIILAVFVIAVAVLVFFGRENTVAPNTNNPSFPSAGTGGTVLPSTSIPSRAGEPITVRDFIHNGTTAEDPANEGSYYLAGESGYCDAEGNCHKSAPAADFTIVYYAEEEAFAIALTKEPLGEARKHAEQFLMQELGIGESELCALNYFLITDAYTNEQYAGLDLGFSFCPGSIPLP